MKEIIHSLKSDSTRKIDPILLGDYFLEMKPFTKRTHGLVFCFLLGLLNYAANAQNIEDEVKKIKDLKSLPKKMLEEGIKINGGISSNTTFYQNNAVESTGRAPFESILSGNLNINIFGKIQMPFTFTFNSQNVSFKSPFDERLRFQQPFNRYQFKPTYKSLSLLLGVNSMTFSPNTLNGHRFEGYGLVFKPTKKPYYASFMWGNLQKSVRKDSSGKTANNQVAYARNGWGFQLGYKAKQYSAEVSMLKSGDDVKSLPYTIDSVAKPQSNVVVGFKGNLLLYKKLALNMDIAYSGLTKDNRDATDEPVSPQFSFLGLLHTNRSTVLRKAIKSGLQYNGKTYKVGLDYSRIDPDYVTHGAYYFVNDLENINANVASQFLQKKLSVTAALGRQHNNLNQANNLQTLWQWVGSASLTFVPSEKLLANINYSSFTSYTNLRTDLEYLTSITPYASLDTLNYRQVNQNVQWNVMKLLAGSTKEIKKMILLNGVLQSSINQQGGLSQDANIAMLNTQYSFSDQKQQKSFALGLNLSRNDLVISKEWLMGPTANYSRAFFNKQLKTQASLNYLKTFKNNNQQSNILNARLNFSASFQKKHNLSLGFLWMYRNVRPLNSISPDYWDMTATLSYQYSLSTQLFKKKTTTTP